jgi:predicted amidohydrolase YtcJ
MSLVLRNVELSPGRRADVRLDDGVVAEIGQAAIGPADRVLEGRGGALLPGLHDHHIHVLATAASWSSVDASGDLAAAVADARRARPAGWLRATGYHVGAQGELDRHALDRIDTEPLRVQDHTGSTWFLNSAGLAALHVGEPPPGMELDEGGAPTGRLFRLDEWLRERTGGVAPADVAGLGRLLASLGVTSLTDATATNGTAELALLAGVGLPQRLTCMTGPRRVAVPPGIALGAVKVLLDDTELPELEILTATIAHAHGQARAIAVHCVTRVQLVLTVAALDAAGAAPGDRIEHAGVVPDDLVPELRRLGVTVVTQPGFVAARGDRYLDDVDADDVPCLYRLAGLLDAGIPVRGSSDAPYGPLDPWLGMAAAHHRRTASGAILGAGEALDGRRALALYADRAGVAVDDPADLCLVAEPWRHVLTHPGEATVMATVVAGDAVYEA